MATTAYIEPGTYVFDEESKVIRNTEATVKMYPLFVGRIPQNLPVSKTIVRSDSETINGKQCDIIDAEYASGFNITSVKNAYSSAKEYKHDEVFLEQVIDEATGNIGLNWTQHFTSTTIKIYQRYVMCETRPSNITTGDYYVIVKSVNDTEEIETSEVAFNGETEYKFRQIIAGDTIPYAVPVYRDAIIRAVKESDQTFAKAEGSETAKTVPSEIKIPGTETTETDGKKTRKVNTTVNYLSVTETTEAKESAKEGYIPSIGVPYKISFTFSPAENSEYFMLKEWEKASDAEAFYGADTEAVDYTDAGIGFNPLPTAARIANEIGCRHFFTLGIKVPTLIPGKSKSGSQNGYSIKENPGIVFSKDLSGRYRIVKGQSVAAIDDGDFIPTEGIPVIDANATYVSAYQSALENQCDDVSIEKSYRIVPLDQGQDIALTLRNHVIDFSSEEERLECAGFYSLPYSEQTHISYDDYLSEVTASATAMASSRMVISYGNGVRKLSNNTQVSLNTQYLLVAVAALEQLIENGTSLTNTTIPLAVFSAIDTPSMRRKVKNEIASSGVLILEQRPSTAAIKVRHAITTLYNNKYGKELSVQRDIDYVKKYLRGICNPYIGRSNVDDTTIELVRETIDIGLETLLKGGWITQGAITSIAVDEDNPDTILVEVKIKVPFPLNYIYIRLVLDN